LEERIPKCDLGSASDEGFGLAENPTGVANPCHLFYAKVVLSSSHLKADDAGRAGSGAEAKKRHAERLRSKFRIGRALIKVCSMSF
jgi:hypothetical protein